MWSFCLPTSAHRYDTYPWDVAQGIATVIAEDGTCATLYLRVAVPVCVLNLSLVADTEIDAAIRFTVIDPRKGIYMFLLTRADWPSLKRLCVPQIKASSKNTVISLVTRQKVRALFSCTH